MKTICEMFEDFRLLSPQGKEAIQQYCLYILEKAADELLQALRNQHGDGSLYAPQEANIQIQRLICHVVISNLHRSRSCMFHGSNDLFSDILAHCDRFSDANNRGDAILTTSQATPIRFTFSTEYILYLFFVATECHSLAVRSKAIDALRRCCRREKFWDSFHAASVAEWLLHEEEKKRKHQRQESKDLPGNRLVLSSLQLFQEDDVLLAFRRPGWARVEVEDVQGLKEYWIHIGEAVFGGPPPKSTPRSPTNRRLCLTLSNPIWPAAAKTMGQMCMFGEIRTLMDLP
ncbi:hypothetical protein H2200_013007 [Cladophialophora chaetospira]|uniref:Uncharacterized protein n=1 Tax=Cladophialophora chaetospira TaxID=386627 RepID=A0AA39CBN9_9EURO|nr:hypothetical protein H2200_013007 [Cladophialophora chaetospira]